MKNYTRYFTLSLLILSSAICHAALQNGKVQVATTKGESSLTDPKSVKELVVSGKLFEQGYKVETNKEATVELCLSNGSTLLVNSDTLIEVRTFRQVASNLIIDGAYQKLDREPSPSVVEIVVVKGKIIGEVRKLNPQSSFTIKTPAGVARIRGTVYSVEYKKDIQSGTGNMEVSCVKGSVEVSVNGTNSGPVPVEPGKKMTAKAPIVDESEGSKKSDEIVSKKTATAAPAADEKVISLHDTEGLQPGAKIKGDGLPDDVVVVSVDPETKKVTLNKPVTVESGVEISVVSSAPTKEIEKKAETKVAVADQKVLDLINVEGLQPGMKIQGAGLPGDLVIVAVDPEKHQIIVDQPVTIEAGVKIVPVVEKEIVPPPSIVTPIVSITRLDPVEIKKISTDIASGTSLPPKLTEEIQKIADNTPAPKPTVTNDGDKTTKPDETKPDETKTEDTPKPPTNTGGSTGTGGVNQVIDSINKTIQETIEKENQNNPSPTGG